MYMHLSQKLQHSDVRKNALVNLTTSYLHALDGRLRVKVAEVKGLPARALDLERRLRQIVGIEDVKANPTTGNVLILYASDRLTQQDILQTLCTWGYLRAQRHAPTAMPGTVTPRLPLSDVLAETLVRSSVELALQGLVRALI